MKSTEHFKNVIKTYLDKMANADLLFAVTYAKPNKNIDDCITYILNTVNGFADEEIYSMAVHYYDEDNINAGNPVGCSVVVNHHIELTEEEKQQARKDAMLRLQNETYSQMKQPKNSSRQTSVDRVPTLFSF
jgi:FMN-dependent NADH-azoreductase